MPRMQEDSLLAGLQNVDRAACGLYGKILAMFDAAELTQGLIETCRHH